VRDFVERLTTLQITAVLHADADDLWSVSFFRGINATTLTNNRLQTESCAIQELYKCWGWVEKQTEELTTS